MYTFKFGKWTVEVVEGVHYHIFNCEKGKRRYYEVVPGKKYSEPLIVAEPELAFEPPLNLRYVNKRGEAAIPDQKVADIICQNGPRGSLTNLESMDETVSVNPDGSLQVGEKKWWIATLFLKDKNRFRGYDAYCVNQPPNQVRILELGDLDLFS